MSHTIFGTFSALDQRQRLAVIAYLGEAWRAQFGRSLGPLSVDLEALAPLYAPTLTAKRLRSFGDNLRRITARRPALGPALFIAVDSERGFVTPEGRVLLEIVGEDADVPMFAGGPILSLIDFYSAPRREWIVKTLTGGDLRPATLGFVLFLLLNGSTSSRNALRIPDTVEDEERLARAIIPVINAFLVGLETTALSGRELTRLRSNWAISEARAQLPALVRSEDQGQSRLIYIVEGQESAALTAIARALASRRGLNPQKLDDALSNAALAYDHSKPLLLSWGLSWGSDARTQDVLSSLEHLVMQAPSRSSQ